MNNLKMRAAILAAPRKITITEVVRPEPTSNEVCVELEGCGVCASNLSPWEGKPWFSYPMEAGAPGHEGWGVVHSIGAKFRVGDRVVLRLAASAGAKVIAITRRQDGLQLEKHYGAVACIPMEDHWQVIDRVKQLTDGRFCEVVVEATGKQWPLDLSAEITAERGRLVIAGYHQDGPRQINMQLWNWRGLDVINAHERDPKIYRQGMEAAIEAIVAGDFNPTPLYTHCYSLDRIGEAFEAAANRPAGFTKALVMF
jgi:threonine dehydrogenase-like Zn-dependent dehydrogenase